MYLFNTPDIAIDLGTSNTMVYVAGKGILIAEPTLIAVSAADKHAVRAVGDEALQLMGRTGDAISTIAPISAGVIDDYDATCAMLRYFVQKAVGSSLLKKPRLIISIPAGLPAMQREAISAAGKYAGARQVILVEKTIAAAIGTGLPVFDPIGSMVVDIGGGTTDIAVISIGGIVASVSIAVGGKKMDESIINYLRQNSSIQISSQVAEELKKDLASAEAMPDNREVTIMGRDIYAAHGMSVVFKPAQAHEAVKESCRAILEAIIFVLRHTPPELAADIQRTGIYLTGGASNLNGMVEYIARELNLPVQRAIKPEDCTIAGLGQLVENKLLLEQLIEFQEIN